MMVTAGGWPPAHSNRILVHYIVYMVTISVLACVVIANATRAPGPSVRFPPVFSPTFCRHKRFPFTLLRTLCKNAFFPSFVFNRLRTLVRSLFSSKPFFSDGCALFAQKQGVGGYAHYSRIGTRNTRRAGMKASATAFFCIFCSSLRAIRLFSAACALRTENTGGGG